MKQGWKAEELPAGFGHAKGWVWKASSTITFVIGNVVPLSWEKPRPFILTLVLKFSEGRKMDVQVDRYETLEQAQQAATKVFNEITKGK